ncbi:MAG: Ycf51 family protein [Roseofilum sp. SBFL]|uniref:Ycf51 family protein n=1 Tax=unclassified Roseofilum TaxID=2620099 RepID=UPI001B195B93|nr:MULTISPECIES: Ycf51 family protein [unclassified Roseofilum]MBP0013971.1 Ycf51 family protein [Roseofilum sp. SID3]MBP0026369.1 Ycf51 family protein [Roseofilum sp. SID2]MBP0040305.1 Ycf51 family protein [Roseofilum sp. SID1]MBP0041967.1 Ycf51 family protein [Roseofilum sp. SBFL]
MPTTADFLQASEWFAIATGVTIAFTVLCFIFKWGFRFRFVGVSSFMVVLTVSVFALSLVPFTRTVVPGAVRYSLVFDNGATHTVIAVPPQITESELEATLKQAAMNLFSYGRPTTEGDLPTVLARTIIHPEPQISEPIYLGKAKQSVYQEDRDIKVEINQQQLNLLQTLNPS